MTIFISFRFTLRYFKFGKKSLMDVFRVKVSNISPMTLADQRQNERKKENKKQKRGN